MANDNRKQHLRDDAGVEGTRECRLIDDSAARHVDDARALLHPAEGIVVENALQSGTAPVDPLKAPPKHSLR